MTGINNSIRFKMYRPIIHKKVAAAYTTATFFQQSLKLDFLASVCEVVDTASPDNTLNTLLDALEDN